MFKCCECSNFSNATARKLAFISACRIVLDRRRVWRTVHPPSPLFEELASSAWTLPAGLQLLRLLATLPYIHVYLPRVRPGQSPLYLHFPIFPPSTPFLLFSIFPFLTRFIYFLVFPCPSIRIGPLRFQAGCRRRRLNLALVFCVLILC